MFRMTRLLDQEMAQIVRITAPIWAPLRDGRILLTGATGFFGCWLLESLVAANKELGLGLRIIAQSRDPAKFLKWMPHLGAAAGIHWLQVRPDELTTDAIESGRLDAIIHLVTEADHGATRENPDAARATIVGSTQRALDLALATQARYFLFTSSGSVYARPGGGVGRIPETHPLSEVTTDPASGYAFSGGLKRQAEALCTTSTKQHGLNVTIARCFTFVGPHMPLRGKFAMGNFLGDALHGRDIVIQGDGTPVRSYLYAADLAVWLWTILLRGSPGAVYNVGSEQMISLRDLAEVVRREVAPAVKVKILGQPAPAGSVDRYVPDTTLARREMGLQESTLLDEAVRRTANWARQGR
jgi:dTDP-glucose 4,6-dehydratase